jgi:hypothetical protein
VARSRVADSEVAPQWSALVAGCPELPRAVSGCFVPAATFIHVPVIGCFTLVLLERRARSWLHADLKSNVEGGDWSPRTNESKIRSSSTRVKRPHVRVPPLFVLLAQTVLQPNVHRGRWVLRFD